MTMAGDDPEGHAAPHTQPDPAGAGADPGDDEADLAAVLACSPDVADKTVLAVAAELAAIERRGRGRPAGSPNRKNRDMIAYLAQLGHRDPWVTLSMIQSADTRKLAKALGVDSPKLRMQLFAVQKAAAEALLPYHHAKMPTQIELPIGAARPQIVFGDGANVAIMTGNGSAAAEFLAPQQSEENQRVIDGDAVRGEDVSSHDQAKPLDDNDNPAQID